MQPVRQCIVELRREQVCSLENFTIADVSCGSGSWLLEFAQWEELAETWYRIGPACAAQKTVLLPLICEREMHDI